MSFYEAEADVKRAGTLQFLILSCFTAIGLMWRLFIIEFTMNKYNHRLRSTGQQLQGSRMAVSTTQYQIQIPHQERWPIVFGGGLEPVWLGVTCWPIRIACGSLCPSGRL